MRITGGMLGGRQIKVPRAGVWPTQDRVRAALFSMLAPRLPGRRFLDLYAGSGAVGLDAWSRGAGFVCWVESSRRVRAVLEENVRGLCDSRARVVGAEAVAFLKKRLVEPGFDIIFCDPPYEQVRRECVRRELFSALREAGALQPGGLVVVEQDAGGDAGQPEGWQLVNDRVYGQTRLQFFRLGGPPAARAREDRSSLQGRDGEKETSL